MKGKVLDVAVDVRPGSKTLGKHVSVELSEEQPQAVFHSKRVRTRIQRPERRGDLPVQVRHLYCPESEGAVASDDPDLEIDWMVPKDKIILYEKDKRHPKLRDCRPEDLP